MPVPEAEPVVARHRATLDAAAGWGIPAHVTVLFPFAPPEQLDAALIGALAATVAGVPAFGCVFRRTGWFGDDVLWLDPEPADAFRALTATVVRAFPQWLPYRGEFSDVVPHLTVGERRFADLDTLRAAAGGRRARAPGRDDRSRGPAHRRLGRAVVVAHGRPAPARRRTRHGCRDGPLNGTHVGFDRGSGGGRRPGRSGSADASSRD